MKKSWHPQRSGNVAATHKAEAEAIAERKKLQQRIQEIEEERIRFLVPGPPTQALGRQLNQATNSLLTFELDHLGPV